MKLPEILWSEKGPVLVKDNTAHLWDDTVINISECRTFDDETLFNLLKSKPRLEFLYNQALKCDKCKSTVKEVLYACWKTIEGL